MVTNWRFILGSAIVILITALAVGAPIVAPYSPTSSSVFFLQPTSAEHLFGTDDLGRDVLSRVIFGSQTSLAVGLGAAMISILVGVPVGLAAGYFRGITDGIIVPLIDLFIALPGLVLALIITVMIGPSMENLILVLGFVMWPTVARLVRGQTLALRELTFIEAAHAAGGTPYWIIRQHIWPNLARIVAAQFAITVSFSIFTSASLSFLGLGIPPPTPDWGGMVRSGFDLLAINPLMSLGPGAAVSVTVMGFYLMGSSVE